MHWSKKRRTSYKEYPFTTISVFEVPYSGEATVVKVQAALDAKNITKSTTGNSFGDTIYSLLEIDTVRKILTIETQYFIGDKHGAV